MAKNSIDVPMWLQRIQRAEDLQAQITQERKQAIKLYTGTFFGSPVLDSELTEVNFVYEYEKILVGSIYSRNPHIFCRARSSKYSAFAETMETVINQYWSKLRLKGKIKQSVLDASLIPPGFIEIGYNLLKTPKQKAIDDIEKEFPELKDKNKKILDEAAQGILEETIKEDDVFAEFTSSWDIIWPDGYHDIRTCPYIAKKLKISLLDLLNNPNFNDNKYRLASSKNVIATKQNVKPYRMQDTPVLNFGNSYARDEEQVIVDLYYVWDRRNKKRFVLAKNFIEGTLYEKDWGYLLDGFPYYPLIFNEIPKTDEKANSYPMSDVIPMLPQLKELSYISSAMNKHRRRTGTVILTRKGALSDAEKTNIQMASDVDLIELPNLDEQTIRAFSTPALPQDFYKIRALLLEDLMRISGFNQLLYNSRGIETATESENVRAGALIRQTERQDIIEDFTRDVAKGLSALIWQFKQDKNEISKIIGEPVDEDMWPSLPEDEEDARQLIQHELLFDVEAGSTRPPKDEAVERKQWLDLVSVLKATFPNRLRDDLTIKQILKKFDFKDIDRLVISYDEEEIAVAQEENKLLMQGIPQVVGPNENDILHLQTHGQLYQIPDVQPTLQAAQHIDAHAKSMERKSPTANPQRGDSKIAPVSTAPDVKRTGVPENADLVGSMRNMPGIGGNAGGK